MKWTNVRSWSLNLKEKGFHGKDVMKPSSKMVWFSTVCEGRGCIWSGKHDGKYTKTEANFVEVEKEFIARTLY